MTDDHTHDIASLACRETEKGSSTFYSSVPLVVVACVNEDCDLCPPSTGYRLPAVPNPLLFASPPQRNLECATIWKVELTLLERLRVLSVAPSAYLVVQTGHTCLQSRLISKTLTDPSSDSSALYSSLLLSHHALRHRRSRCNRYEKLPKLQQLQLLKRARLHQVSPGNTLPSTSTLTQNVPVRPHSPSPSRDGRKRS